MATDFGKCDFGHRSGGPACWRALVALLCLALNPLSAGELPDTIDQVRPSVVGVGSAYPPRGASDGGSIAFHGTGFVVGNGLQVVTALHVLPRELDSENGQALAVFVGHGSQSNARSARLARMDPQHDLALLELQGEPLTPLALADSRQAREGQSVAFTGFPLGLVLGLHPATHRGIISSIAPVLPPAGDARSLTAAQILARRDRFQVLQLDATAYPGNSGSPVYDPQNGRVWGVLNSTLVRQPDSPAAERPSGVSFAIPAEYVQKLLAAAAAESAD